ncbi:bifunctional glutamate N-acetyltransferase/amino-acid acetyltransferase ArgJ [bacterium]|nr:bifunctional glutamate N-acetyltransferase/amino-acid acetyltransferase ArgJ [bacterium]
MLKWVDGGVTAPLGFIAGGVNCGIKGKNLDCAAVVSDTLANVAGCFTTNKVKAAPVLLCRKYIKKNSKIKGVIINSGCANACTGGQGMKNAEDMSVYAAQLLNSNPSEIFILSTGRIGVQLPMDKIKTGIKEVIASCSKDSHSTAAQAIMTTDNFSKETACAIAIDTQTVKIGAMAKGAGMINPNMATMLAVITTDANIDESFLKEVTKEVVENTFNRITVDGDMSTNDSVIVMANGQAENSLITASSKDAQVFREAMRKVSEYLSHQIVRDGEGATKFVEISIKGAQDNDNALKAAQAVANSLLLKVALSGSDPNWGRIMSSLGSSGIEFDPHKVDVFLNGMIWIQNGILTNTDFKAVEEKWTSEHLIIGIDLHQGTGFNSYYTCDISHKYIDINI